MSRSFSVAPPSKTNVIPVDWRTTDEGERIPIISDGEYVWDEILLIEDAQPDQVEAMAKGHRYDYTKQMWVEGNDHAHTSTISPQVHPVYCGANRRACYGGKDYAHQS